MKKLRVNFIIKSQLIDERMGYYQTDERTQTVESYGYPFPMVNNHQAEQPEKYLSFQRNETYRFGVVCFNSKLQASFVQVPDNPDIKIPDFDAAPLTTLVPGEGKMYANILQIEFDTTGIDFPEDTVAYQIVRVPRTQENRSVIDMGLLGCISDAHYNVDPRFIHDHQIVEYTSPEILYNKSAVIGDNLEPIYTLQNQTRDDYAFAKMRLNTDVWLASQKFSTWKYIERKTQHRIEDLLLYNHIDSTKHKFTFKGKSLASSINHKAGNSRRRAAKGSHAILYTPGWVGDAYLNHIIMARRTKTGVYGDIKSNTFVPCSSIVSTNERKVRVWGDTFIKNFEFLRGVFCTDVSGNTDRLQLTTILPVETSIDLDLITNPTVSTLSDIRIEDLDIDKKERHTWRGLQERKGVHDLFDPADKDDPTFMQDFDLYTYNAAYSRTSDIRSYTTKPDTLREDDSIDVRIYHSDRKIDMELEDSWLNFRGFLDVDTSYGKLTRLFNFKNNLYYFQPKGYGILSVDQRELVQTEGGGTLALGAGGMLERYDYLSTETGTGLYDSIAASERALYFIDNLNKKISRVGEKQTENISDIGNIKSWVSKLNMNTGISSYHSHDNVLFFKIDNKDTLVYNEDVQRFTGFYSMRPDLFINLDDLLITHKNIPGTTQGLYLLNGKNFIPGNFGGVLYSNKLSIIVNPHNRLVQRFDVLSFLTYVFNNTGEELNDKSFDTIRVSNTYQDTGNIQFTDEAIRRHKVWRLNQFRDQETEERMKDSYIKIDVAFSNSDNGIIKINDIVIDYFSIKPY